MQTLSASAEEAAPGVAEGAASPDAEERAFHASVAVPAAPAQAGGVPANSAVSVVNVLGAEPSVAPDAMKNETLHHAGTADTRDAATRAAANGDAELFSDASEGDLLPHAPTPAPEAETASMRDADLETLRRLLFSREIALLEALRNRLDTRFQAREVGDVIAEAILLRTHKDDRLNKALEPMVEEMLKTALRKSPTDFTGVLFPLMGPAIRRSISETFRAMLEGLSKTLEISFSWKGLRWRLEALRSGKSFSEVVLLHTLVYRVEQVFLIHTETGLVLGHAVNDGVDTQDADLVSAMLTAIQDFVRDCFTGEGGDLDSIRMGEFTIYMEKNEQAILACVVRGTPPADFRAGIRTNFELMLMESADALSSFNGDTAPFLLIHRRLDDCLSARFVDEDKPLPLWTKIVPATLVLALLFGFGWWRYDVAKTREAKVVAALVRKTERDLLQAGKLRALEILRREDGLLPTAFDESEQKPWRIQVLRDDLADDPKDVLAAHGIAPGDVDLIAVPFVSYAPELVLLRVRNKISPPETVRMVFEDGVLSFSGTAPIDWIIKSKQESLTLPGVKRVDTDNLRDPRSDELTRLVRAVESVRVEFPLGGDMPVPSDLPVLLDAVDKLVALEKLAREMGISAGVTIYGHADAIGTPKRNYEVSQARAKTLASMLYAKGSGLPVSTYGMGSDYADKGHPSTGLEQADRRIELRVHLIRAADASSEVMRK
jgi:hypothetical protein